MADKRPLFDDEDLPEWLKKAGITFAGKPAPETDSARPEAPRSVLPVSSGGTGALPWVNETSTPEVSIPSGAADQFDFPDWMNAPEAAAPPSEPIASADELPPWMRESPVSPTAPTSTSGVDFDDLPMPDFDNLDWSAPADSNTASAPSMGSTTSGMTAGLPWRQGASDPADEPLGAAESADDGLSWFADQKDEAAAPTFEPPPEPEAPQVPRGLKNLLNKPLPTPEAPRPPAASDPNLTFEQWEQRESQKAAGETADSFAALNVMDAPAASEPDWLSAVTETPNQPVPDWLNADAPGTPALDFDAMFGENAPPLPDAEPLPDWLNAAAPPKPQPPSSGTRVLSDLDLIPDRSETSDSAAPAEIPDWLQQMTPAASSAPIETATTANVDDWLRDFTSEAPTAPVSEPSTPATVASGEVPDWLRDMSPSVPPSTPIPSAAAPDQLDIPDWMRDMAPAASTPIAEPPQALDDWFSDLPQTPEAPAAEPGALPDWLSGVQPGTLSPAPKPAAPQPSRANLDIDLSRPLASSEIDALMNMPISASPAAPEKKPVDSSSTSLDFDLDELLGPLPTTPAAESTSDTSLSRPTFPTARPTPTEPSGPLRKIPTAPKPAPVAPPSGAISTPDLPDFVADLRPTDAPVPLSVGPIRVGVQEVPLAQLTDQLRQLRERAREFKPPEPTQVSTTGPLAEIKDTLAVEPIIVQSSSQPATVATVIAGDLQARRVKIIQNLLELEDDQPAAETTKAKAPASARPKLDRLLITIVLLLALIAPFLTDAINLMGAPGTSSPTAAQAAVFAAMDGIPAGQPVLVAFEYGPTGSGELDDLSRVLLRDLFKKGAKPVIVSTNPSGAMHAEGLLSTFGRSSDELTALNRVDKPLLPRTDYVVLRYLPAGAAGVRSVVNAMYFGGFEAQSSFLTDIEGQASGLSDTDVKRLQGAPAVVLAETADDVRNWAEQFRAPASLSGITPPKIILAAAAAADATAHTYSASLPAVIIGPLVGLRDATVYRTLRQPPAKAADAKALDQRWQSTGLGALVAGLIIFLGMILNLIRALRRRGSGATQGARR